MAASDDDRIELTELDVITRYSLAVRTATADRAELIAALRDDLAWLEAGRSRPRPAKKASPAGGSRTSSAAKTAAAPRSRSARGR